MTAVAAEGAAERAARARALLAGAEARLGLVRQADVSSPAAPAPPAGSPAREQSAAAPAAALPAVHGALPLDDTVAALIPGGALRRGTVTVVRGSTSLQLALAARASREGAWVAAVGMPHVGIAAASGRGIDLARLALVPHPGAEAAAAVAACVDGMDVVLMGERLALGDPDRRRLVARARERGAVLISAGAWAGAHVQLDVAGSAWAGLGAGDGRLRSRTLTVSRTGRRLGGSDRIDVVLDEDTALPGSRYPGRARQAGRSLRLV